MASENRDHLDLEDRLKRLNEIGVALSAKRDLIALLELILQEARSFTRADAGTLYLVRGDFLSFEITQNNTLQSFMGGSHGKLDIPPVPRNKESVSGYAAVTGETLNIADVYTDQKYRFEGPKQYDRMTGYRTTSMLVVPMQDHEDQVIGVVQLLNATDPDNNQVKAFSTQDEALIQSLASQAAVAINNVRLIEETRQLSAQMVQSERMASVGILAAGIVHNLRNPLMTVMGFGELIQQMHPDIQGIDEIVASGHRMSEMIEDILTKSRQRKTPEEVDFNLLINRELDFMNSDATFKHKVEKTIELAAELPLFECVYTDFSQTVGNLMRNALDAMHDRDERKLTVRSLLQDDHIVIEVGDTGCGIPAENRSSLFDPFFTTKATEAEGNEPVGTGLGLYMIARLMEPYEAKITFDSQVDVGTTFRLEIPLQRPPVPELPEDIEGIGERP